jgi:hypothetical protein
MSYDFDTTLSSTGHWQMYHEPYFMFRTNQDTSQLEIDHVIEFVSLHVLYMNRVMDLSLGKRNESHYLLHMART